MEIINKKEQIIAHINLRVGAIIADANTFLWIRQEMPEKLKKIPKIGGGNLLMILGLFSVLNFMGKVYRILLKGKGCIIEKEKVELLEKIIRENPEIRDLVPLKSRGEIRDEESAFVKIVNDSCINFGLNEEGLRIAWKSFRNYLSHSATIKPGDSSVTFLVPNIKFEQIIEKVKKGKEQAFGTNQFGLKCYPDILIVKVEEIKEWLVNKIESDEYSEEKIEAVFGWIQDWE